MLSSLRAVLGLTLVALVATDSFAQSLLPQTRPPPDGGDPRHRRPEAPDYRVYEYGKEVYAVKLGCQSCPLGSAPLDEATARRFLSDDSLWAGLSTEEEEAVSKYLRELYGIR